MTDVAGRNFVLLINSAAFSREYFTEFGRSLEKLGAGATFVLESHLSDVMSGGGNALANSRYFTDFCKAWQASGAALPAVPDVPWSVVLSDFDRFLTYEMVPPLTQGGRMDYAEVLALLDAFFDQIFDELQPAGVVYEQVSNSFAMSAYRVAKRRGIPFFSIAPARIAGHIEISPTGALRDHELLDGILAAVRRDGIRPESRRVAEDYIESVERRVPDYMLKGGDGAVLMDTGLFGKYANREKFDRIVRSIRYRRDHRDDMALAYQTGDPLRVSWALFRRSVKRRLRGAAVAKLFQHEVKAKRFFLYPLHYHPEASTSVLASDYIDELTVIKAIAFRLPTDVKLVVKEHPSATALQPLSFYRELDALPNVELVAPGLNSKSLARRAIGVVCLTSTLGFEGAALNKPVICLGDVLYGYFPNVRMIEHFGDLSDALDWAMAYQPIDPERIVEAMAAYVEYIDPGSFSFKGSLQDTAAIDHVARILLEKLPKGRDGPRGSAAVPAATITA